MPNSKDYRETANLKKRKNRRESAIACPPDEDNIPVPTLAEIKDALGNVRESTDAILRLAALMDNVSLHHSPRLTDDNDYRGRTDGVRNYLAQDGYLASRYATLMRFKKLGHALREKAGIMCLSNLLWGFLPECPLKDEGSIADWQTTRKLFASFNGMNFKQILAATTEEV